MESKAKQSKQNKPGPERQRIQHKQKHSTTPPLCGGIKNGIGSIVDATLNLCYKSMNFCVSHLEKWENVQKAGAKEEKREKKSWVCRERNTTIFFTVWTKSEV